MAIRTGRYVKCSVCGKDFYVCKYESHRVLCSTKCWGISVRGVNNHQWKRTLHKCTVCEKEFYPRTDTLGMYCSVKCRSVKQRGAGNPQYKGLREQRGYQLVKNVNHSRRKDGYIQIYRLIAEKCLGRKLTGKEVIHHINGNKSDNRPENLYLFDGYDAHTKFERCKDKKLVSNLSSFALKI